MGAHPWAQTCALTLVVAWQTWSSHVHGAPLSNNATEPVPSAVMPPRPRYPWEAHYAYWRHREVIPVALWRSRMPAPVPKPRSIAEHVSLPEDTQRREFDACLILQAKTFAAHVMRYRSPDLAEITSQVNMELARRRAKVSVAVFWGRERYVNILWRYLERNLRANAGIVDEVLLVTHNRDGEEGAAGARAILDAAVEKYPGVVREEAFCSQPYGCAFDEIMTDPASIYVKLDDDIVFVKDGSFEHLVWQVLFNGGNYSFFSGSVVNNPHSYGVHGFAGAYPPTTYHWRHIGPANPPLVNASNAVKQYYGSNVYDVTGSQAHEAFVYNVARGRLDVYTFDTWNLHQCQCGYPQRGLDYCKEGWYRWSINAFAYLKNATRVQKGKVPKFDEPFIGINWPDRMAPHRVGIAGESLFVHCQYTRQRLSQPDFGLRESILLPWYTVLADQYLNTRFNSWGGNTTLLHLYERLAFAAGENRFSRMVDPFRSKVYQAQLPSQGFRLASD